MLSCYHLPETERWGVWGGMWLLRECVLVDLWGSCYCLSPSLIYFHSTFAYTEKVFLHGHWPGILINLSARFSNLVAMQLIPKLCWPDFSGKLSWCPSHFRSTPRPYYLHSSWSVPWHPFLHGMDLIPCEISPGGSCLPLAFSMTSTGWKVGQRGTWWGSAKANVGSCTWGGTTPCTNTGSGQTCWRAALWRGTWVSWWMTG